jgi:hypothetical protein
MKNRLHALVAACGLFGGSLALADEHRMTTPLLPTYQQECASCHMAYPPQMLSAGSWQRLMGTLPHHFGTDASLDATMQASLSAWLTAHAGTGRRVEAAPPEDRISRTAWFERKHRRIDTATWRRPAIKSASNCSACHRNAAAGDFEEDAVVIPR